MRIIDSTRVSMGWNNPFQTRRLDQIKKIGIHHSATSSVYLTANLKDWWFRFNLRAPPINYSICQSN